MSHYLTFVIACISVGALLTVTCFFVRSRWGDFMAGLVGYFAILLLIFPFAVSLVLTVSTDYCPSCDDFVDKGEYCNICGNDLHVTVDCICGAEYDENRVPPYCSDCGNKLK